MPDSDPTLSRPPDRGSVAVEMVVLTPILILLTIFIVYLGRAGGGSERVRHAADVAARAASIVSIGQMQHVADLVATADLLDNGADCASTSVAVSINGAPGAQSVTVAVTCVVNVDGLSLLGSPAASISATSTEVIDRLRGGP